MSTPTGLLRGLLRASHPEPTVAVTVLTSALAVGVGADPVVVGAAVLVGQLSVGWSNDWIDAPRDRAVGRKDKPATTGLSTRVIRAAALAALALTVPLSLLMGAYAGIGHLVAIASAWSYNAVLKSTVLSFLPYALSFGLLPSVVTLNVPGHPFAPWWATTAGVLLGLGAHGANVLPDLADDELTGVRGLPQRLGRRRTTLIAGVLLTAATVLLAAGPGWSPLGVVAVVAAPSILGGGLLLGSRAPFFAVLVVAVLDVVLLVARGSALTGA